MNLFTIRKALTALATIVSVLLAVLGTPDEAKAATAMLVSCNAGTSVTGQFIYTGTYQYAGHTIVRSFASYCPMNIEVQ